MPHLSFVKDWGGFEELIAALNNTGEVTAERNVRLTGLSGVERQIDVLITHREGLFTHKILGECKCWKKSVGRAHIDAMITAVNDLGASKGAFFTTVGYQSGAEEMARRNNIDLFLIREPTPAEWGHPGRHVLLYLQVVSLSLVEVRFPNPLQSWIFDPSVFSPDIKLNLGDPTQSRSRILPEAERPETTLEAFLEDVAMRAYRTIPTFLINNGEDCVTYAQFAVNVPIKSPLRVAVPGGMAIIPSLSFDLGIKFSQSKIEVDRLESHTFALAVENCVNHARFMASQRKGVEKATLTPVDINPEEAPPADALTNGSVVRVLTKGWFPPSELEGLDQVEADWGQAFSKA